MAKLLSLIFGVAVATITAAGSASAADMALKAPPPVVAPVVVPWTGCYVGGNGGLGIQNTKIYDPAHVDLETSPYEAWTNGIGFAAGGQVGCDYQVNSNWVVGVRGMIDALRINQNQGYNLCGGDPDCSGALGIRTNWFATALGKVGYLAVPNGLVYVKGGAAWKNVSYTDTFADCGCVWNGHATTILGYDVGAGFEYLFIPNLSAFVELDYMGFPTKSATITDQFGGTETFDYTHSILAILVGLNLRFHP